MARGVRVTSQLPVFLSLRLFMLTALMLTACATPERLTYTDVESTALDRTMSYAVWTPADLDAQERLPLMVFLHGAADDETCFDDAGVGQALDHALSEGRIPRAIVVVPDGRLGFWENWYDGSQNYRDWVIEEVMPEVEARYGTLPCPEGCHVAGISMGGHGAVRFALFSPYQFASVASLSGFILSTDDVTDFADEWFTRLFIPMDRIWGPISERDRIERQDPYLRWNSQSGLNGMRLMVAWAEEDETRIVGSNEAFRQHLVESQVEHESVVFEGGHNWKSWTPVIEQVLRFAIWGSVDAVASSAGGARPRLAEFDAAMDGGVEGEVVGEVGGEDAGS